MAAVSAPWRRASASTETMSGLLPLWLMPMTRALAKRGRLVVDREQARRGQSNDQAVNGAEQVLGVAAGIVAGAACRDHAMGDMPLAQIGHQALDVRASCSIARRGRAGLLVDLLVNAALFEHRFLAIRYDLAAESHAPGALRQVQDVHILGRTVARGATASVSRVNCRRSSSGGSFAFRTNTNTGWISVGWPVWFSA